MNAESFYTSCSNLDPRRLRPNPLFFRLLVLLSSVVGQRTRRKCGRCPLLPRKLSATQAPQKGGKQEGVPGAWRDGGDNADDHSAYVREGACRAVHHLACTDKAAAHSGTRVSRSTLHSLPVPVPVPVSLLAATRIWPSLKRGASVLGPSGLHLLFVPCISIPVLRDSRCVLGREGLHYHRCS